MLKRICKQCGKEFILSNSEIKFYKEKKLYLPKRCSECRKENKKNNNTLNIDNNIGKESDYSLNNKSSKIKIVRNIIIAMLIAIFPFVGKWYRGVNKSELDIKSLINSSRNTSFLEFRNEQYLEEHFNKHGNEFKYTTKEEYLNGANQVIASETSMYKKEAEDSDEIYYDEAKNEIVFVSQDGYIRTYFKPTDGINYFNKQ